MKLILLFTLLLFNIQNKNLVIDFINEDTFEKVQDIISITVLDENLIDNDYYNSKTYFTVEGYIVLPYNDKGINIIVGTCSESLFYYILPDVYHTVFIVKSCDVN